MAEAKVVQSRSKAERNKYNPNFWGMMQNVLIESLRKGQFLIGMLGFIIIIIVLKMPGEEVSQLMMKVILLFKQLYLLGWFLAFITTITSVYLLSEVRKLNNKEVEKIDD